MTTKYPVGEARRWALEALRGCCGCISPTFSSDLTDLNEEAIRFDVALAKAHGLAGLLIVSEAGTTPAEMARFTEIVVDEAGDDLITVLQASQPTLAETIASVQQGAACGVDLVMPSYPLYFNPASTEEVVAFTKAVADAGDPNAGMNFAPMYLGKAKRIRACCPGRRHVSHVSPSSQRACRGRS